MNLKEKINKKDFYLPAMYMFLVAIVFMFCFRSFQGNDFWWHTKAGEYIIENKTIPFIDVFSWYGVENSLHWISHEWLSEVVLYLLNSILGLKGVFVISVLLIGFLVFLLFVFNKDAFKEKPVFSFIWFLIGVVALNMSLTPRPHLFSFILLAITMHILNTLRKNEKSNVIWFLPIVSFLWANLHGGSSNLPYILVIIFILGGLFEFSWLRFQFKKLSKLQFKKYIVAGLLSVVALCVNPHGFKILTYPYVNMQDSYMLKIISEWRAPDLKVQGDLIIFLCIAIILLVLFLTTIKIDFTDFMILGAFIFLTFKSVRFVALLFIVASFLICKYVNKINIPIPVKRVLYCDLLVIMPIFMLMALSTKKNLVLEPTRLLSKEAITAIKDVSPNRLYNDYNFGADLIYNDIPVFIDGRADMYSSTILEKSQMLSHVNTYSHSGNNIEFKTLLNDFNFDYMLVYKNTALSNYMSNSPIEYELIFEDDVCKLFKNNNYARKI